MWMIYSLISSELLFFVFKGKRLVLFEQVAVGWSDCPAISGHFNTCPVQQWDKNAYIGLWLLWLSLRHVDWHEKEYLRWNVIHTTTYYHLNWISFEHIAGTVTLILVDLIIIAEGKETLTKIWVKFYLKIYIYLSLVNSSKVTQGFICVSYFPLFFVFIEHWKNKPKTSVILE